MGKLEEGELRVHTEWQRSLSGVHFVMDGKISPGWRIVRIGGARSPPFHYIYHPPVKKLQCRLQLECADIFTLIHLYQYMYSVAGNVTFEWRGHCFCPEFSRLISRKVICFIMPHASSDLSVTPWCIPSAASSIDMQGVSLSPTCMGFPFSPL